MIKEFIDGVIVEKRLAIIEQSIYNELNYLCIDESVILMEGTTNREMISKIKEEISKTKKEFHAGKKALKVNDKDTAMVHFKKSSNIMNELEQYLRNINDFENGSKIIGNILGLFGHLGFFFIIQISTLCYHIFVKYKANKLIEDIVMCKNIIYDISGINLHNDRVNRTRVNRTVIKGFNDLETLWNRILNNSKTIDNLKNKSIKALIVNWVAAVLNIIKLSKQRSQINANGGVTDRSNMLRELLITYCMNIKTCLDGYIKLCKIDIEE